MNCGRSSFLSTRNFLSKETFCWVFVLVFSFSWSSINCLQTLKLWFCKSIVKEGNVSNTDSLSITSHDRLERREKPIRIFSLVKKIVSGFWLVQKIVWPMRLLLIKERLFLCGEFALSKSQYLYNKTRYTHANYESILKWLRRFSGKRTRHRFPMNLGMLLLQDKEILKTNKKSWSTCLFSCHNADKCLFRWLLLISVRKK